MTRNVKPLGRAVKTWKGCERIGEKLECIPGRLVEKCMDAYAKEKTWGYNVLNHGDFHLRNLMFKKDKEDNLTDIMFLDFQIPLYRTPAFDLYYLLNLICDDDARERDGEVIKMYHQELLSNLEKYGYKGKVPSLIDVHVELLHLVDFGKVLVPQMVKGMR